MLGAASVSSFAKRARVFISAAARSKPGAMAWHGPHQSAQKSTTTGSSVRVTAASKVASLTGTGLPSASGALHLPHTGPSASRSAGTRLRVEQLGQPISTVSCLKHADHGAVRDERFGALLQPLAVLALKRGTIGIRLEQAPDLGDVFRRQRGDLELLQAHDQRGERAEPGERRIVDQRLQELAVGHAAAAALVAFALGVDQRLVQLEEWAAEVLEGRHAR